MTVASNGDPSDTASDSSANTSHGAANNVGLSSGSQSVIVAVDVEHNSDPVTTVTTSDPQSVEMI